MDNILWKIRSCSTKKLEPEYNGFELQDWETFGPHEPQVDHDWLGEILAVIFMLIIASLLKYFRVQDDFLREILRPECFAISVSGLLVVSFLVDFNLRKLAILISIGFIIIFV